MRKVLYFILIVLFVVIAFGVFTVAMALNSARQVADPVGSFVRDLVVPATAVVLPDPVVIVQEVRDLARLETASYSMEKVVRAERGQDMLWGALGETMIFVAHGEVIAGVDLAKMSEEDIQVVDPVTVQVHLPEAEIFNVVLDNDRSYVADRDTGVLTRADPQLETQVRQSAQQELENAAVESDILDRANENAESYMRRFLQNLGFENIVFTETTPPPAPPFQQEIPKGYTLETPVP